MLKARVRNWLLSGVLAMTVLAVAAPAQGAGGVWADPVDDVALGNDISEVHYANNEKAIIMSVRFHQSSATWAYITSWVMKDKQGTKCKNGQGPIYEGSNIYCNGRLTSPDQTCTTGWDIVEEYAEVLKVKRRCLRPLGDKVSIKVTAINSSDEVAWTPFMARG